MKNRSTVRTSTPRRLAPYLLALAAAASLATPAGAVAGENDSIVTDRPDFVESSNVVGKGRLQVETSIAVERNKADGVRERTVSTPTLLRIGISDTWELRVETDGRVVARSEDMATGARQTERGYADTALGVKWHALDAAGYAPSVGLLVHADMDSGSAAFRGAGVRPSLRVAAEWELPDDFSLGLMPGLIYDKDEQGRRFTGAIFGAVLGKEWNDRFRTFVEVSAPQIARAGHGGSVTTFDVGAAYLLTPNCQIDSALSRGLNHNTPDLSWTVGISFKL